MLWNTDLKSIFSVDRFDLADWQDTVGAIPKIGHADDYAAKEFCGNPVRDAFFGLKWAAPQFNDPTPAGLQPLADLMRRGMETPEWEGLHQTSIGDNVAAAIGAHGFVEGVLKALPPEAKQAAQKAEEAQERAEEIEAQAQNLLEFAQMLAEQGQDEKAQDLQQKAEQFQQTAQGLADFAANLTAQVMEAIETHGAQIAAAANRAAKQANEQAQETSALVKSYSLAAGGDPAHVEAAIAGSAMRALRNNPNLKDLAEMLGWAKRTVRAEWRKSPKGHTTLTGYRVHDLQPAKMASGEYVAMVSDNEAVALDFERRAADSAISHRHYAGDDKSGRGELVLVRDESGSMSGSSHALAVALEWALLEIARRDKREFVSIPFSGPGQFHAWRAPQAGKGLRQAQSQDLERHLSHFFGGGTEPYAPISQALKEIADNDLRADVLVITDGDFAEPAAEFLAEVKVARAKRPLKVVTVIIGGARGQERAAKFSDKVINLADLVRDREKLREAVAGVI